ncbi:DUF2061 domain-containing protein [Sneathiella glossodoripedis]|uniref:DUF2061 domain-containing protein n=1 Tax=Sneathiella glossodoripedis TaxID=418853 RepID=UPI00131F11F4
MLKAISWQILGLVTSFSISWLFLGSIGEAGEMTFFLTLTAFCLYFLHERFWNRINF